MFDVASLTNKQRLALGIIVLIIVDLIWVASSELTEYIFKNENYQKPFFTTYIKTAMFTIYLTGFLLKKTWRQQCRWPKTNKQEGVKDGHLSDPVYVPIRDPDDGYSSIDSSDTEFQQISPSRRSVRFNDHTEVRVMTATHADEAVLARLSYNEYMRKQAEQRKLERMFPVPSVCKLALVFCVLWFVASFSYQEALLLTQAGIVNILSSTSGLFTLVLAAIWSSGPMDRFTLSKLLAVIFSLGGTAMICLSDAEMELQFPVGAVWALVGAVAYALYLVTLKRKVKDEEQLDIPMFFGFVGFFDLIILWPGLLILHYTAAEVFTIPTTTELILILVNGLVGTVLSELLWLWGCFLTSSLIGTLALSLTTPLTMLFDVCIKKVSYSWMFYVGMTPVFLSFIAVTALSHYENWDPALICLKKGTKCITRALQAARLREMESDQTQHLLAGDKALA